MRKKQSCSRREIYKLATAATVSYQKVPAATKRPWIVQTFARYKAGEFFCECFVFCAVEELGCVLPTVLGTHYLSIYRRLPTVRLALCSASSNQHYVMLQCKFSNRSFIFSSATSLSNVIRPPVNFHMVVGHSPLNCTWSLDCLFSHLDQGVTTFPLFLI